MVNRREVCECDGLVCDLDVMGPPPKLSVLRKVAVLARVRPTFDLSCEEKAARRKLTLHGASNTRTLVVYLQQNKKKAKAKNPLLFFSNLFTFWKRGRCSRSGDNQSDQTG